MRDAYRGIGLVDVLSARPRGTVGVDAQIRRIDLDLIDLIELGEDCDGARRGMDAALRLGGGHALHAVGTRLELQPRERAFTGDATDDLAVAPVLTGALAEHLRAEALGFGIARVHAVEVAGEDRRLVATGAGPHLEEYVALIARILRQQQAAQLELFGIERASEQCELFATERPQAGVGVRLQLARRLHIALESLVALQVLRERLQACVFHRQLTELPRGARDLFAREQPPDLLVAIGESLQALADGVLHGVGSGAMAAPWWGPAPAQAPLALSQPRARHSPGCVLCVTSCAMRGARGPSIVIWCQG